MHRARRRLVRSAIAAVGAATLLPTAGCGVFDGNDTVLLLGDSLTVLVSDEVKKAAPAGTDLEVSAEWGKRIDEEIDAARQLGADDPRQVIVNLGTNNVLQRYDVTASSSDLTTLLEAFDGSSCIHLVTINEHINRMGEDFAAGAVALNQEIRTIAQRRTNVDVVDWNQIVVDHAADGIMSDDGVHPNAAGVALLAEAYAAAIEDC